MPVLKRFADEAEAAKAEKMMEVAKTYQEAVKEAGYILLKIQELEREIRENGKK